MRMAQQRSIRAQEKNFMAKRDGTIAPDHEPKRFGINEPTPHTYWGYVIEALLPRSWWRGTPGQEPQTRPGSQGLAPRNQIGTFVQSVSPSAR